MSVASMSFLVFGLTVALLYNVDRRVAWRQSVLLVANAAFLTTFSLTPRAWLPYACFLFFGYLSYLLARRRARKIYIPLLVFILVAFVWLKKYTFLPSGMFLSFPYVTLGLSYVLFRVLHLIIDTSEGVISEYIDPVTFLNYTLNFTAVISGPIQRYQDYASTQLVAQRPRLDIFDVGIAIERIIFGLFKISILGLALQTLQSRALAGLDVVSGAPLNDRITACIVIGASYPLYLYCNFSGYTDIVIGMARGFRLVLPENFDRPFESTNFLDFWGRWHMTLSNWLKTYVYSPLLKAMMQRFPDPKLIPYWGVISFFVTFFLIGIWHGQTSAFLVYGILLGLGVSMNKLYQILLVQRIGRKSYKALSANLSYRAIARGLTFTYFTFSLIWFWSSWSQLQAITHAVGGQALMLACISIFLLATTLLAAYELIRSGVLTIVRGGRPLVSSRYVRVVWATALIVVMSAVLGLLSIPAPEVVYKAF